MRPSSRGGFPGTPTGGGSGAANPGLGQLRPGTMSRGMLSSRGGIPPGTAGARLRTGMAPGTQAAGMGIALATEVQVADRPVTQQGMRGMKTGALGPGRQVADHSFYIGVLRSKVNEITAEIRKLKIEMEQHNRDNSHYGQFERKYESLLKDVRSLEGALADYNLAMDKLRTSTDPEEVRQYHREVEAKNRREAQEVDRIFLIKQQREKETSDIEGQVLAFQRQAEEKINNLEPRKLQLYKELINRTHALQAEVQAQTSAIELAGAQIRQLQDASAGPVFNEQYAMMEKRVIRLQREKVDLDEDFAIAQMDPKDAQANLLAKVKEDNKQLSELDQRCKGLKEELASKRRHLADLTTDMADRKNQDSGDSQKYEVLYKRDQEMTEFIEKFDEAKTSIIADQQKVQGTIVALLEHISQGLEVETSLPSEQRFKMTDPFRQKVALLTQEMKDEVTFKERQLESSQVTMSRLADERSKRLQELQKIDTLDEKIASELKVIQEKKINMENEMVEFEDSEGLKSRADETQTYLNECRRNYIRRRDSVKQQVQLLSSAYDAKKKSLAGNETANALDSLEQKLKQYEQATFGMKEFIETKMRETDFQGLKDECIRFAAQLNMLHRQLDEHHHGLK